MARYKVLEKSFINNFTYEEGDEVEYEGEPGSALQLIVPASEETKEHTRGKKDADKE